MAYVKPTYHQAWKTSAHSNFSCPHCNTYALQRWSGLYVHYFSRDLKSTVVSMCDACHEASIWLEEKLISPVIRLAPSPNADIPADCASDYEEARSIVEISPKGAAALLRLCLQKLLKNLGQKGENINNDIAELVKLGLPTQIQQALDICRVVGNNAVHPGEIVLDEDPETASSLFELINLIVEDRITQPKKVAEMYANLPDKYKEAIEKRDKKQ